MSPLEVRGLGYTLSRTLLEDITLDFRPGEMTAVSGPSGSGKTTLLSLAGGLLEPTVGTTTYAGSPTWRGTGDPRPEMAFVLQVYGLVPILSARENVAIALRARGVEPADADELAEAALARFHIADLGDRQVEELSGGQMQRVACARGLVVAPEVLLADEPTSELDEGNRSLVLAELRGEANRGAVVVVATHDPAVVEACDRHYALDEGRLVPTPAEPGRHRGPVQPTAVPETPPEPAAPEPAAPEPAAPQPAAPEPAAPTATPPTLIPPAAAPPPDRSPFARPVDPSDAGPDRRGDA